MTVLPRRGDVWRGVRPSTQGRIIRVDREGADGYVHYTVVSGKKGVRRSRATGRMSALSLRAGYELVRLS